MLFNSFEFIFLFLPISFFLWLTLCRKRLYGVALFALLISSVFFYGYWNPPYLVLLMLSIVVNFCIQRAITQETSRRKIKFYLFLGVFINLLLIGYFKYANFFLSSIVALFGGRWIDREIFLPLGISFFTFQQIACLVDTYRGKIGRVPFLKYALFVSFFPQLIAGPIVLADSLFPQFDRCRTFAFYWIKFYVCVELL